MQYERMVDSVEKQWAIRLSQSLVCDGEEEDEDMEGGYVEQQTLKVSC